jgi:hypothetical protein
MRVFVSSRTGIKEEQNEGRERRRIQQSKPGHFSRYRD